MVSLRYPGWSPGRTCNFAEFQLQFPQTLYIYMCVCVCVLFCFREWQLAKPRTGVSVFLSCCMVSAIWTSHAYVWTFSTRKGKVSGATLTSMDTTLWTQDFQPLTTFSLLPALLLLFLVRKMQSNFNIQKAASSKCLCVCVCVSMGAGTNCALTRQNPKICWVYAVTFTSMPFLETFRPFREW